jgi:intracellular sulfur oxidation DsrE/DsrF family protein
MKSLGIAATAILMLIGLSANGQSGTPGKALLTDKGVKEKGITFIWSSSNAKQMDNCIAPYSKYLTQKNKWNDVTLVIWGPAVHVLEKNENLQSDVEKLMSKGVEVKASQTAAVKYNALEDFNEIGVEVGKVEKELTADLKGDASRLIDF